MTAYLLGWWCALTGRHWLAKRPTTGYGELSWHKCYLCKTLVPCYIEIL